MSEGRVVRWANAAAVAVSAALASLYVTPQIVDPDEAILAGVGMRMKTFGLPPYEAGWEPKPPLPYDLCRVVFELFGDWNMTAVHVVSAVLWAAASVIVGFAARRLLGAGAFAPAVVAYALLRSYFRAMGGAADSEALMSPFLAYGVYSLLCTPFDGRRAALLGGASLAVAVLFKPPVALYGPAAVVGVLIVAGPRAAWTTAWGGAVGAFAVLGASVLRLALVHDLEGAWICNVDVNRIYIAHGRVTSLGQRLATQWSKMRGETPQWVIAATALATALAFPKWLGEPRAVRRWCAALAVVLATGVYIVTLGGYFFHHYWVMVHPVLAVVIAAAWVGLVDWKAKGLVAWLRRGVAFALLFLLWLPDHRVDKKHLFLEREEGAFDAAKQMPGVVAAIQRRTSPAETIWIWGWNPQLYVAARRVSGSRFITCGGILWGSLKHEVRTGKIPPEPDVIPTAWPRLFDDLESFKPKLIVDVSDSPYFNTSIFDVPKFPRLRKYLDERYDEAERVDGCVLYVRKPE